MWIKYISARMAVTSEFQLLGKFKVKVNNRNTKKGVKYAQSLTIKTPEQRL